MVRFSDGIKIPKWFGDFGGDLCFNDTDFIRKSPGVSEIEEILTTEEFESEFRKNLRLLNLPSLNVNEVHLEEGRLLLQTRCLARHYNLAAQLALAVIMGKTDIFIGTYSKEIAEAAAAICWDLSMSLTIVLSRRLGRDQELLERLRAYDCEVDADTCRQYFDLPYAYSEIPFFTEDNRYAVPVEANYGSYPKPGLTGKLAGLYGEDLLKHLKEIPDCCAVYINTGTGAIGTFKALMAIGCTLMTVEDPVAHEYHLIDTGAYTISTRNAKHEQMNTTLCPELVDWWRSGHVLRLGCDRVRPVHGDFPNDADLTENTVYAASLGFEKTGCKKLLVLEETV